MADVLDVEACALRLSELRSARTYLEYEVMLTQRRLHDLEEFLGVCEGQVERAEHDLRQANEDRRNLVYREFDTDSNEVEVKGVRPKP